MHLLCDLPELLGVTEDKGAISSLRNCNEDALEVLGGPGVANIEGVIGGRLDGGCDIAPRGF
eukprot:754591-Amorphochlora_amoeboformis.AAC.1